MKTFLKNATVLSVFDFKNDEKSYLVRCCMLLLSRMKLIDADPEQLDITFIEFVVMRHRLYSPSEILEIRRAIQLNDDRTMH